MSYLRLAVVLFVALPLSVFAAPVPAPNSPSASDVEHKVNWPAYGGNANPTPTPSVDPSKSTTTSISDNDTTTTTTNSNNNDNDDNIAILNKSGNVIGNTVASNIGNDNDILNDNVVAVLSGNSLTTGDVELDLLGDGLLGA